MPLNLREHLDRGSLPQLDGAVFRLRLGLLPEGDRRLLEAVCLSGSSVAALAELAGQPAYRLRRRVHNLLQRIRSRGFLAAERIITKLEPQAATLARLHLCGGLSLRQAAGQAGLSYHQARTLLQQVRGAIRQTTRGEDPIKSAGVLLKLVGANGRRAG